MNVVLLATRRLPAAYFETVRTDLGSAPDLQLDVVAWAPPREPLEDRVRRFVLIGPGRMPLAGPAPTPAKPLPERSEPVEPSQRGGQAMPSGPAAATDPVAAPGGPRRGAPRRLAVAVRWRYRRLRRWAGRLRGRMPGSVRRSRPVRWLRTRRGKEVSRAYWSRVAARPDVLDVIDRADVVVALDSAAAWAGWKLGRRTADTPVVLGVLAARRELDRLRQPD